MGTFANEQVLYNNNPSPTTAVGLAQMRYNQTAIRELPGASAPVIVEITDGAISPTSAFVRVDTEGQAGGDDLEVISPILSDTDSLHDGMILYLQAADQDRVVTVRSTASANGIQTFDGQDVVLDAKTWLVLQLRQGTWYEMRELSTDKLYGSQVPVGSIIWSAASTVPAGYLLCNGASVGRDTYPELFAAIGTTYGEGDGSTTFNLPNLIGRFIEGASTAGTVKEAGVPDFTGSLGAVVMHQNAITDPAYYTGAFKSSQYVNTDACANASGRALFRVNFRASDGNPIYGNSPTVQPPAVTALPCIKAFSSVVGDATVVAAELVDDIMARTDSAQAAHAAMPNWDATINFPSLSTSANWQALSTPAPADGYLKVQAVINSASQSAAVGLRINGRQVPIYNYDGSNMSMNFVTMIPVNAGDTFEIYFNVNINPASTNYCNITFFYANGTTPTI